MHPLILALIFLAGSSSVFNRSRDASRIMDRYRHPRLSALLGDNSSPDTEDTEGPVARLRAQMGVVPGLFIKPETVGKYFWHLTTEKLKEDTNEALLNDKVHPLIDCVIAMSHGEKPDELGLRLATLIMPLFGDSLNALSPTTRHGVKLLLSHYLMKNVIKNWSTRPEKRTEIWERLLRESSPLEEVIPSDYLLGGPEYRPELRRRQVSGAKTFIFRHFPDPHKNLRDHSPLELFNERMGAAAEENIDDKVVQSKFFSRLFQEQIWYDLASALLDGKPLAIVEMSVGGAVGVEKEKGKEKEMTKLEKKLVELVGPQAKLYDFVDEKIIAKFMTNRVLEPWTSDSKKSTELSRILGIDI